MSVRALRYYEEQGLLSSERSPGGQRQYDEGAVERVRFFQQMYGAGLTSRNIAVLLPCIETGHTDQAQRRMLADQRAHIQAKIDELQTALSELDRVIEVTHSRVPMA